jgi:hypothetical protein
MTSLLRRSLQVICVALVGAVLISAFAVTPAGAHVGGTVNHLWTKHIRPLAKQLFYSKSQSNDRYYTKSQANTRFVKKSAVAAITQVKAPSSTVASGATVGVTAFCPAGTIVIGGGWDGGAAATAWRIHRNVRVVGNGWRVFGTNQTVGDSFLEARAYCLAQ